MKILIIQITVFHNISMLHPFPEVGSTVTGDLETWHGDNENYDAKDDGKRDH